MIQLYKKGGIFTERKLKKNLIIFTVLNLSLISFALIYTLCVKRLEGTENEIKCFVQNTLHIYCPGCCGSRSLEAFLKFDFIKSFLLYPAIPLAAIAVLVYDTRLLLTLIKKDTRYTDGYKFKIFIIIPIAILLTFLVRNILLLGFGIDTVGDIIK